MPLWGQMRPAPANPVQGRHRSGPPVTGGPLPRSALPCRRGKPPRALVLSWSVSSMRCCQATGTAACTGAGGTLVEVMGDGLKPLTTSQTPSDSSQKKIGSVAITDMAETCS